MAFNENGLIVPDPIPASVVLGESVVSEHPVLTPLKNRIAELEREVEVVKGNADNYRNRWNILANQRYTLENALATFVEDEEIEIDVAQKIADIFDISLTKKIDVELTYKVTVSVEVPLGDDVSVDDVADNVSISVDYYGSGEMLESDSDLDDWREIS